MYSQYILSSVFWQKGYSWIVLIRKWLCKSKIALWEFWPAIWPSLLVVKAASVKMPSLTFRYCIRLSCIKTHRNMRLQNCVCLWYMWNLHCILYVWQEICSQLAPTSHQTFSQSQPSSCWVVFYCLLFFTLLLCCNQSCVKKRSEQVE